MVWHQYTVRLPDARDELLRWLQEREIEAAVYYPETVPAQPLYRELGYDEDGLPVARRLGREVLSLPVHPLLAESDLAQVVEAVNEWTEARERGSLERATRAQ